MNKLLRITALVGSLWAVPAIAADNALVVTPGSGVTVRSIDIGAGVQAPGHALVDAAGGQLGVSGAPLYVRVPSAAIASGAYASGSIASGAFASGSVASGAFASGSLAAGAMVDLLTMRGTVAAGTAAANSMLTGCVYNSTPITLSNGQQAAVQCSVNGYPTVTVSNTNANGQATMANSSPVVIASNQSAIPVTMTSTTITGTVAATQSGTWTVQPGNTQNTTPWLTRPSDGTRNAIIDPCEATLQTSAPISITTATTTRIVAPSASNKTYICALFLTSAAADNVGIVEGTGGTCGSGTAGVIGGTTAANGPNFAANGGVFLQAGGKVAVAQTAGTNVDLCLITSAATPLAGVIKYVQAP